MIKKLKYIRWVILIFLLMGVAVFRWMPGTGEWYARYLYPAVSGGLSAVASLVPFSLTEVIVVGMFLLLVSLPWILRRKGYRWRTVFGRQTELLLWVYVWFYWGWGINYFRADFFQRAGIQPERYDETAFKHFLADYTERLNASFARPEILSFAQLESLLKPLYRETPECFRLTTPRTFQKPKFTLFTPLYSSVGVLGFMGPFFAESHLNSDLLPVQLPFTYAHELSHLLGVSSEAEANFWAYQICIRSAHPAVCYSGYFGILPYVASNARSVLTKAEYKEWLATVHPEILRQLSEEQSYWSERYSLLIGTIQDAIYNWYLKGNRISSGQKNYAEVVGMILALPADWWR